MSKETEKLVEQLNEQTDVIEKLREGLERICELEDDDEAGAARVIAKELLGSFTFLEGRGGGRGRGRGGHRGMTMAEEVLWLGVLALSVALLVSSAVLSL